MRGAFATAVDQTIFDALGIAPIDHAKTSTPHGEAESPVYPASLTFPGLALTEHPMERVIGCNLKWQTVEGKEIIMLLGRDLLQYFLMVYNGKSSDVFLAYGQFSKPPTASHQTMAGVISPFHPWTPGRTVDE
jgi:hypothetical protein